MSDTIPIERNTPDRLARIREKARLHQQELESVRWFGVAQLAIRWGVSQTTVRKIPRDQLPYLELGGGDLPRRRYHPDEVARFEESGRVPKRGAA